MAKEHFDKLFELAARLDEIVREMQCVFAVSIYNGRLYVWGQQCISWSRAGLAFKLLPSQVMRLTRRGDASEQRIICFMAR